MTLYKISGLWKKKIDENGVTFYYNFTTKEIIAKSFQNKLLYISDESFGIHFFEKENSLNPTIFFEKNPILRKIEIDFGSDSLITQKYIIKSGHFEGKNPFPRSNYGIGIVPMPSTIYFETRLKY